MALTPTPIGALDRDRLVEQVLTQLAATRSAWNAADIRGEVELLIAAEGVAVEAAVRLELAEDLTARALGRCVPLLDRTGVPEHVRAWTSRPVLDVEADLTARFAARAGQPSLREPQPERLPSWLGERLDAGQAAAVAVLSGGRPLVLMEGAAGSGKTTTLAAARHVLERQGRQLVVVTPTLKAAKVARAGVGTATGSAAALAYAYGWRWTGTGAWTRLADGETDPGTGRVHASPAAGAWLRSGDLLVIDEAGMLDQDTARALLVVADECRARVALLGDRHQLAAVGRGGVLDLAAAAVDPAACLTLESVHRFTRTDETGVTVPDGEYAELTLAMRRGDDPGAVFEALVARGRIRLHPDHASLQDALAATATAAAAGNGRAADVAVVADTREQVAALNSAIRGRLVIDGRVDDTHVMTTRAGQRIGAGDRIVTRRNDFGLAVANRDTWTVLEVGGRGGLLATRHPATDDTSRADTAAYNRPPVRVLPDDYGTEHVELAYASTAYGVQGETVTAAHVVIGDPSGAASVYVGMTRGRQANTGHLVAADIPEARAQWIAAFGRDRADLGPGHAAALAAREAARYAPTQRTTRAPVVTRPRPPAPAPQSRRPEPGPGPSLARRGAAPGFGR